MSGWYVKQLVPRVHCSEILVQNLLGRVLACDVSVGDAQLWGATDPRGKFSKEWQRIYISYPFPLILD